MNMRGERMETYFNRMMRTVKRWICTGILLGAAISMTACGETLTSKDNSATKQASEVFSGIVGEEDEEQIRTLIADFTEAAKYKDYNTILPYYAVEDYVRGYNMELAKENFGDQAIQPTVAERTQDAATRYTIFVFGFAAEVISKAGTEPLSVEELNGIANGIDLASLTVKRIDIPMEEELTSDLYQKMLTNRCDRYGTENIAYRTVLYEMDGDTYYCGFTLYCYGGTWEIGDLACDLIAVDSTTVTIPCNEEEYLALIETE